MPIVCIPKKEGYIMKTKLNCEKKLDDFFALDKHEPIPLNITAHLLFCKNCKKTMELYLKAEHLMSEPLKAELPFNHKILQTVLKTVNSSKQNEPVLQELPLKQWIYAGISLMVAIFLFVTLGFQKIDPVLHFLIYFCFAGFITGYCAFFVGSHLNYFSEKLKTLNDRALLP